MRLSSALLIISSLAAGCRAKDEETTVWATPHDSYSSSVGVLGCKIDTDRVAYWPQPVSCDDICVSLSYDGRSVKLLRVDQSQGAHDVSYDAWNYLYTGKSATEAPAAGGAVEMTARRLDASDCRGLIRTKGKKLPLSAANSMNFLASCLGNDTWVGGHYRLYNVADSICSLGRDEECDLDWEGGANQAECPHQLGDQSVLEGAPVYNIRYPSGERVLASTGEVDEDSGAAAGLGLVWDSVLVAAALALFVVVLV